MNIRVSHSPRSPSEKRAAIFVVSSDRAASLPNVLRKWLDQTGFKPEFGQYTYSIHDNRLHIIIGAGEPDEWSPLRARRLGGHLAGVARRLKLTSPELHLETSSPLNIRPVHVRALMTGLVEGGYQLPDQRRSESTFKIENIDLVIPEGSVSDFLHAAQRGRDVGTVINEVRDIANQPGNIAPPMAIAAQARALAKRHRLKCTVWDRQRLLREKCHAFLAVSAGSHQPPCLIQLAYPGRATSLRPLVVIGKTITFDTGGISLKPGKSMEWMKFDKSGGMAVLAFMALVGSVLKPERPVIGMLAAAENMPGGSATRPGDVVRARNGKTIEIVNTDAEGRLVLADTLDVARALKPAAIIDLATLTGAASVALGRPYSAVLSNHPPLSAHLQAAGDDSGDRLWALPLDAEYKGLLKSPFADLKNIGDGTAGTIVGGIFLEHFVPREIPWAHIDLTSAWEERATAHGPAGATLFGAALLAQWVDRGGLEALDA